MSLTAGHRRFPRTGAFGAGLSLAVLILTARAGAAPLRPGDFVMVTWSSGTSACCQVVALDPASLTESVITSGEFIVDPQDIAVSARGDLYVTVPTIGVVRVDPVSGAQSIFASVNSLGGGQPFGIFVGPEGFYVTLRGSPARIVQLDADGSIARVVSSGGMLDLVAGLTVGPDGALYVCETIPYGLAPGGGLVRVDLASGSQALLASEEPINGPFDVTLAPDGSLWSVQRNHRLHERRGALVRTTCPDGVSELLPSRYDFYVTGVAIRPDGLTVMAQCAPVHGDCEYASTYVYPDGPNLSQGRDGPLAVVPDRTTSVRRPSWGRLKLLYR